MISFSKDALVEMGREHWKEYLPKKYQDLLDKGTLDQELLVAAEMTLQIMEDDQESGYTQIEAWEKNQERYLLLPEPMPDNPAYSAMVEMNRVLQEPWDDK